MNSWWIAVIAMMVGANGWGGPPKRGVRPMRDGVVVKYIILNVHALGRPRNGINIRGTDSVVVSTINGQVVALFRVGDDMNVMIKTDSLYYTFTEMDSCIVSKGQRVKMGETIGFARDSSIGMVVSTERGRMLGRIDRLVDCQCLLNTYLRSAAYVAKDTAEEDRALSKVFRVREVQAANRRIDSMTHHQHGVSLWVVSRPTAGEPYYQIKAGYNGEERYETYYNFYVYRKGLQVKIYDEVTDSILSLEEWRRRSRKSGQPVYR